jgi:hypothetical protein
MDLRMSMNLNNCVFVRLNFYVIIYMWIQVLIAVLTMPIVAVAFTDWYSKRCVTQAKEIVRGKLREYESIANTYTENGTPGELQALMEQLEEMMDELQMLEDNNPRDE